MPEVPEDPAEGGLDEIAIFPLESVVLLPRVRVPLHIFEPRYRQMTREALETSKQIGMAVVMPDETAKMGSNPPIFPIGCCGKISECEELPDGRFRMVLDGEFRFRIREELPPEGERLYRRARIERLVDEYPESDHASVLSLREETLGLLGTWLRHAAPERKANDANAFAGIDDETLVNALTQSLDFRPVEKQGLVDAGRIVDRYRRLVGLMRFRLAEMGGMGGAEPGAVH